MLSHLLQQVSLLLTSLSSTGVHYGLGRHIDSVPPLHLLKLAQVNLPSSPKPTYLTSRGFIFLTIDLGSFYFYNKDLDSSSLPANIWAAELHSLLCLRCGVLRY